LIAHADDILEFGEWDEILRIVGAKLSDEESSKWLDILGDREALEKRFAEMSPPLPTFHEELLHQCWRMALADGAGSEIEGEVHDRIAETIGFDRDRAESLRTAWTEAAATRAELVVSFAAAMANIDGRMDSAEAVQFDSLLDRSPVPVSRRLELAEMLYQPPKINDVAARMMALSAAEREAVLYELVPLVQASARGEREREVYFDLAEKAAISRERAEKLLEGG
jgi:uncharacterized tellurite resistance protein B-like protein